MPTATEDSTLSIALIGNPNTGKSTLFTALVGIHQHVGNYPGVTVEKKSGLMDDQGRRFEVIDLPGIYSLAPRSRDEMVTVDVLLGCQDGTRAVDGVICIVDAANLDRHLYLVSQVLELGLPTVLALNMVDVAESQGIRLDVKRLQERLGIPVIPMKAHRRIGLAELKVALAETIASAESGAGQEGDGQAKRHDSAVFPEPFHREVDQLETLLRRQGVCHGQDRLLSRYLVERLLLDVNGYLQRALLPSANGELGAHLSGARQRLEEAGWAVPGVETAARFTWASRVLDGVVKRPEQYRVTVSDRIDRVLTHRLWGTLVFVLVMFVVFQAVFVWAEPLMDAIESGVQLVAAWVESLMADGALRSLLVDGVISGVGGILAFLPQILILFMFIAILEDCGYMARAAYLMDRLMARIGLNGKSFIPLLSSFACAVPGVMATRVIENERDRLTTILAAPLMTCSARLPVYALMIAAFIPPTTYFGGLFSLQGLTLAALYALGIVAAVAVALVLKRTLLRGDTPPFLMDLPSYKWPSLRNVVFRVLQRAALFLRMAGTLILAVSILVWAVLYYPHDREAVEGPHRAEIERLEAQLALRPETSEHQAAAERLEQIRWEIAGEYQRQSLLGRTGRLIEPVFRPLGWDWRISSAVIASFPAREIVVATLSVIYNLGDDLDTESATGQEQLSARLHAATWDGTNRPVFTVPVALSIMVFFALCAQCAATLAVIRRETNSWRWPLFTFGYMTVLAYVGALITYQVGTWLLG
ncbi:MAG: ferrous iron transport protein B [Thermoguttaceae bacterium]